MNGASREDGVPGLGKQGDSILHCGILLYLLGHEGKGIGLARKLQAYSLQDGPLQLSEVEANLHLGLPADARRYGAARAALRELGVKSVSLYTNSVRKANALGRLVAATVRWRREERCWEQVCDLKKPSSR